jgi:spermidine/putrescine-binding protein
MNRSRVTVALIAAAGATLLVLSGCSAQPAPAKTSAASKTKLESNLVVGFYGGVIGDAFNDVFVRTCANTLGVNITVEQDLDASRLTKLQAGGSDLDVSVFTDPIMPQVRAAGETTPLSVKSIPNLAHVPAGFKSSDSVPISLAVWGIAYNKTLVSPAPTDWKDLYNAKYKGKVTASSITYSSSYLTLAAYEKIAGGDLVKNPAPGLALMKKVRTNSASFWSSSADMLQQLESGSVSMSPYASGSAAIASTDPGGQNIKFVAPKGNAYPVGFNMVINPKAKDPKASAAFINCVLDAKNQASWINLYPSFPANTQTAVPASVTKWLGGVKKVSDLQKVDWTAIAKVAPSIVSTWQREIN